MLGRSHVMFGLTAAVVLDGVMHVSGPPLATSYTCACRLDYQ